MGSIEFPLYISIGSRSTVVFVFFNNVDGYGVDSLITNIK